jgi:hypothetical protein
MYRAVEQQPVILEDQADAAPELRYLAPGQRLEIPAR